MISSRTDPRVRRIRQLQTREGRQATGQFFTEGLRFLAQAARARVPVQTLIFSRELLRPPLGPRLVKDFRRLGAGCLEVTAEVFQSLSLAEEPQGIAALMRQRWEDPQQLRGAGGKPQELWVALEGIRSPGNLGTIVRTADAAGATGILLLGDAADPYDPSAVRASMGALFTQQFARMTPEDLGRWAGKNGVTIIGAAPETPLDYREIDYGRPVVLLMGEERTGLSTSARALCDSLVSIPMVGSSDSLNLAVATGILLYEALNQRRAR